MSSLDEKLDVIITEDDKPDVFFDINTEVFDEEGLRAKLATIPGYNDETVEHVVNIIRQEHASRLVSKFGTMEDQAKALNELFRKLQFEKRLDNEPKNDRRRRRAGRAAQRAERLDQAIVNERTTPKERKELAAALKNGKLRLKR